MNDKNYGNLEIYSRLHTNDANTKATQMFLEVLI